MFPVLALSTRSSNLAHLYLPYPLIKHWCSYFYDITRELELGITFNLLHPLHHHLSIPQIVVDLFFF